MKTFVLLLVLLATALGQLPMTPVVPTGSFTPATDTQYYSIPGQAVTDPTRSYLLISATSDSAGVTFSASQGCLPNFEFLNAGSFDSDSTCTVVSPGGTCFLQIQPSIIQTGVDTYVQVSNGEAASVTISSALQTIVPQTLQETLDQPISGTLIPGGVALHGPLFVSAGGGYSAVGPPSHIGVILNSAEDFEASLSFEIPNSEQAVNSCNTGGTSCFVTAADTCGVDVVASGNWYIVVRDLSGNGGSYDGFLELRVLPIDPDFQSPFSPGSNGVTTRSTQLNTIERTGALSGAFSITFALNNVDDVLQAHISNTLISAEPCALSSCNSADGVCVLQIDRCDVGPFTLTVTAVNSAQNSATVTFLSTIMSLSPEPSVFGTPITLNAGSQIAQIPSTTPSGAFVVTTNDLSHSTTLSRSSPVTPGSSCPNAASVSTIGVNTILPGCVGGNSGDFFFGVDSLLSTSFTVQNVTPMPATSGVQSTGTLSNGAGAAFSLAYNGVPTVVSIANSATPGEQTFSVTATSSGSCPAVSDSGQSDFAICTPLSSTSPSILLGVHSALSVTTTYDFIPTVQSPIVLTEGTPSAINFNTQSIHQVVLGGATLGSAVFVELSGFTTSLIIEILTDCQIVTAQFCSEFPCRVGVNSAAVASIGPSGRLSAVVSSFIADSGTVTYGSGSNTCVDSAPAPCGATQGPVSVATATSALLASRASNDIAQFSLNGACVATDFVCSFQFPTCDGTGFVELPSTSECLDQFDACGFSCFNACDVGEISPVVDSSAATLSVFFGTYLFILAIF